MVKPIKSRAFTSLKNTFSRGSLKLKKFLSAALITSTLLFGSCTCNPDPPTGVYSCRLQNKCVTKFGISRREKVTLTNSNITLHRNEITGDLSWDLTYQKNSNTGKSKGGHAWTRVYKTESIFGAIIPVGKRGLKIQSLDRSRGFGFDYTCRRTGDLVVVDEEQEPSELEQQTPTKRGVFIRPCLTQFYQSDDPDTPSYVFDDNGDILTVGGTIQEACEDLRDSGVTDLFLSFKSDHEGKGCGDAGRLLYPSRYNTMDQDGFDPVGAIIDTCRSVYKNAGKTLRIHAWVAIFKDRNAAGYGGQKGHIGDWGNQAWGAVFGRGDPECESPIFADPANEYVVSHNLVILDEITERYGSKLYGLSLDYIRYSDIGEVECIGYTDHQDVYEWNVDPDAPANFVKTVVTTYPGFVISGNVMPVSLYRQRLGQENVLDHLDIIMPMTYSRFGAIVSDDMIGLEIDALNNDYPETPIMADLRAWVIPVSDWYFWDTRSDSEVLFDDLNADIGRVAKADGYVLFTYESLLNETGSDSLSSIKERIGF